MASGGLVIDGVVASEHVDSSGEVLRVKGADISSLPVDGTLNFEHQGDSSGSFMATVGKCIKAKKIYDSKDCENDREKMYWDATQVPLIYAVFRLFDNQEDHLSAKAAAAIMRDQKEAGEDQILRFSIEGATLERNGNELVATICRNVALTKKPCNKTAISNILYDPKTDVKEEKDSLEAALENATKGDGSLNKHLSDVPFYYVPFDAPEAQLASALTKLKKAYSAGMPSGNVGTATQGEALQVIKNRAKAALRDYDRIQHGPFKPYLKAQLPEASNEFIEHFSDLVDDLTAQKKVALLKKALTNKLPKAEDVVQPQQNLIVQHNLHAGGLLHANELGGNLVAPSIAITHKDHPLENFGDITLVAHPKMIDPDEGVPVFNADIYSPRHPKANYKIKENAFQKVGDWFAKYHQILGNDGSHGKYGVREELEKYGPESAVSHHYYKPAFELAFLEEAKGKKIDPVMKHDAPKAEYLAHPVVQEFVKLHGAPLYPDDISDDYRNGFTNAVLEAHDKYLKQSGLSDEDTATMRDHFREGRHFHQEDGKLQYGHIVQMAKDAQRAGKMVVDNDATKERINQEMVKHSPDEFKAWARSKLVPAMGSPYFRTQNGAKKAYNVDNLLKEMTKRGKLRGGEGFHYGLGSARAHGATQLGSLQQIRNQQWSLTSDEEMEKHKKALGERFGALAAKIGRYHSDPNGWRTTDSLAEALGESYKKGRSLRTELSRSGFRDVPGHLVDELREIRSDLLNAPTHYFEAKPQRLVGLEEFKGAAVPEGVSPAVLDVLKRHGIDHVEQYGAKQTRKDAINRIAEMQKLKLSEAEWNLEPLAKKGPAVDQDPEIEEPESELKQKKAQAKYDKIIHGIKSGKSKAQLPPAETKEFKVSKRKVPVGGAYFDEGNGVLYTPNNQPMKLYIPNDEQYNTILHDPAINAIHNRALDNWFALHKVARAGQTPPEVIAHAALFSACSPNTAVPLQELAYAHLIDMKERGWDPTKGYSPAENAKFEKEFTSMSKKRMLPQYMRDHFAAKESGVHSKSGGLKSFGLESGKWNSASNYHVLHALLGDLVKQHGVDARSISGVVNAKKAEYERLRDAKKAGDAVNPAAGFAPKTVRYLLGMTGMGNVIVPDTHFLRHSFGLMKEDPRTKIIKSQLLQAHQEPLLSSIDRYYSNHHPAVQHTREKAMERYGEDLGEHAIFPGFWLHWLTVAPHEKVRGWKSRAQNEATDHAVYFNQVRNVLQQYGIPYDRNLLKSEGEDEDVWADGGSMPARTAHAMKAIEDQFGQTPAQFAYYAFMVPALMGQPNHELLKLRTLTKTIQALVKGEPKQPNAVMIGNEMVVPGEIEHLVGMRKGWRNPLLRVGKDWHVIQGDEGNPEKLSPKNEGRTYRIIRHPEHKTHGLMVKVTAHALPKLAESPEQKELLDGIDLTKGTNKCPKERSYTMRNGGTAMWCKNKAGKPGWVKSSDVMKILGGEADSFDDYSTAQREAAFHHLAKNAFGLGEYVPITAAFVHPLTGEHHSIQAKVEGAEHYQRNSQEIKDHLHKLLNEGTLDKLALMDMITGSGDRHPGNYMLTPGNKAGIALIDNGLTFAEHRKDPSENTPAFPHYWERANRNAYSPAGDVSYDWAEQPLAPEAERWVKNLDPKKIEHEMISVGLPERYRKEVLRRVTALKNKVAMGGVPKGVAYMSPFLGFGRPISDLWESARGVGKESIGAELTEGVQKSESGDDEDTRRARSAPMSEEHRLPNVHALIPSYRMKRIAPFQRQKEVYIHRGVPSNVESIRPGDWVALDPRYAKEHADNHGDGWKVVSMKVPAQHVSWAGTDENEWFYTPGNMEGKA